MRRRFSSTYCCEVEVHKKSMPHFRKCPMIGNLRRYQVDESRGTWSRRWNPILQDSDHQGAIDDEIDISMYAMWNQSLGGEQRRLEYHQHGYEHNIILQKLVVAMSIRAVVRVKVGGCIKQNVGCIYTWSWDVSRCPKDQAGSWIRSWIHIGMSGRETVQVDSEWIKRGSSW